MTHGPARRSRITTLLLGACGLALVASGAGCGKSKPQHLTAGDEPTRVREAGFSFVPPSGWQSREMPGLKFKAVLGTPEDGFAPNLNVVDEAFAGSLSAYVDANLQTMGKMMPNFKLAQNVDFKTDDGLDAKKLIAESDQNNLEMRQVFYMMPASGRYYVMTCSDLRGHNGKHDGECDAAARTFRLD